MRTLSASQIQTFKQCKRKWYFKYVLNMPIETSNEEGKGKIIHNCLEAFHNGNSKEDVLAIISDDCFINAEDKTLLTNMMINYFKYDERTPLTAGFDEIKTEFDIEDKTYHHKGVNLNGRIDMLMLNHNARIATIVEHKTSDKDYTLNKFYLHFQTKLYQMMISHQLPGWKVNVMFNILYKRYPRIPTLTSKKEMSRTKIITTKRIVLDFLLENGLDYNNYTDFIENIPNYVFNERFTIIEFKPKFTKLITSDIIDDINRAYSSFYPYGEESPLCDYCPYIDVCVLGDDPSLIQPYLRR